MWKVLDKSRAPDRAELILYERSGEYMIRANGLELMSSLADNSEKSMIKFAYKFIAGKGHVRALIGGLGFGYTLRSTLDTLDDTARVLVAEIVPEVVKWNQKWVGHLADSPLKDERVKIEITDVLSLIRSAEDGFDVILLDVDNGPKALTRKANQYLYTLAGLLEIKAALTSPGVVALWSANRDDAFEENLIEAGFAVEVRDVHVRQNPRVTHSIYLAMKN
jgi:spermidine synthase